MSLELHVWGPAFGLDSIDPECLAAIACFRHALPREEWALVASNDATISPDHILPALNHKGTWTSGYSNIVSYLEKHTDYAIEGGLTPLQRADSLACASYLTSRGSGLLALKLYVSPAAWTEITRPAYSSLLPFPLTWTVPPTIRAAAIEKAEHLGMGYLASEVDVPETAPKGTAETTNTGFLRLRQVLGPGKIMQPEQVAAIRFRHLAEDFYSTLGHVRGDKKFFLRADKPSSLDFLVYGYLSLLRVQTPYPTLKTVLEKSYGQLVDFLAELDAYSQAAELPRKQPSPRGVVGVLGSFADGAIESIPSAGDGWKRWRRGGVKSMGDDVKDPTQLVLAVGGAVAGLAAVGAAVLFRGLSPLGAATHRFEPIREEKVGLHKFGEIGAMLDGLPVWDPPQSSTPTRDTVYHKGDVDVSVGVEP